MIAIIDYGVGNLYSLASSFTYLKEKVIITKDPMKLKEADKLVLPGVGAFSDAISKLKTSGLDKIIIEEVIGGKDILGICLGMQLLFEMSYEYGEHQGLGLLKGTVIPMKGYIEKELKIPHIGWNGLHRIREHDLLKYIKDGEHVYFVHSYFATNCEESLIATCDYGKEITAMVAKDNIMGCQFHPEKSGTVGLSILKAFCERK